MKNKTKYSDEPMEKLRVVKDFLPSPDQMVLKEENVKITISLKKESKGASHFVSKNDSANC